MGHHADHAPVLLGGGGDIEAPVAPARRKQAGEIANGPVNVVEAKDRSGELPCRSRHQNAGRLRIVAGRGP